MRGKAIAVALLLVAGLAGCSGRDNPASQPPVVGGLPQPSVSDSPSAKALEYLPKKMGELSGAGCPGGGIDSCMVTFVVSKISTATKCFKYGTPAKAGQKTIVVDMSVSVRPDATDADILSGLFNSSSFQVKDGELVKEVEYGSCTDAKTPSAFSPGKKYQFSLELAVPSGATTLFMNNFGNPGWSWEM
jgi:hypothetical protein